MTMPQVFSDVSTQQVISDGSRPGPPGANAYDVAVANGFVGSQADWLKSLVGPPTPINLQAEVAAESNVPAASTLGPQDSGKAWTVKATGNLHVWNGYQFVITRFRGFDGDMTKALGDTYYAPISHTHTIAQVSNLQATLDAKVATSTFTGTNILSKLVSADGAGSGLDADLLDGKEATAFAPAVHTHQMSDVFGSVAALASLANLNQVTSGIYRLTGVQVINGPLASPQGTLTCVIQGGVGTQEVVTVSGDKWTRGTLDGVSWTPWKRPSDAVPVATARAMSANQNLSSGAFAKIMFDKNLHNAGGITYSTGDFTVAESGLYTVTALMMIGHTPGGGTWKGGSLRVNGTTIVDIGFDFTQIAAINFSRDVNLNAGDVLNFWAAQYSGSVVPIYSMQNGAGTQVSLRRVGSQAV